MTIRRLGPGHALVVGHFILHGGGQPEQSGWFSTVWERQAAGWRVIHDHSSELITSERHAVTATAGHRGSCLARRGGELGAVYRSDEERMRLAIELARQNVLRGTGGPFGAGVFEAQGGRLVAAGVNSVTRLGNSMLHAETLAIMLAQARLGT